MNETLVIAVPQTVADIAALKRLPEVFEFEVDEGYFSDLTAPVALSRRASIRMFIDEASALGYVSRIFHKLDRNVYVYRFTKRPPKPPAVIENDIDKPIDI